MSAVTTSVVTTRKPQLPALTGIRTLLALSIVLFHFTPSHLGPLYPFVDSGYVFVGVFFLISGYILTYNYADRAGKLNKRNFWVARFARLYPIYLLALLISVKMLEDEWAVRSHAEFWQGVVLTPLVMQGWSPNLATFWNTVAWTLSCEVVLYIAFPWLIRLPWPKSPKRLIAVILVIWAIGLIPHSLYLLLNPDHLTGPVTRYTSTYLIRFLKYTPLPYTCTFLVGVALGKLQHALSITDRQRFAIAAVSSAILLAVFYGVINDLPYLLMHGGLLIPLFAALVLGLSGKNPVASAFAWRPLLIVGESSYCLYLLHFNVLILIRKFHLSQHLHLAAFDPWFSYVFVVLFSLAAFRFVENPARRAILNHFSTQPRVVQTVSS
ncbi:MAG TPA: acyltransferase [Edaphobacter sp.]|nr:acyltransferase [Edaphobacter sp.]